MPNKCTNRNIHLCLRFVKEILSIWNPWRHKHCVCRYNRLPSVWLPAGVVVDASVKSKPAAFTPPTRMISWFKEREKAERGSFIDPPWQRRRKFEAPPRPQIQMGGFFHGSHLTI